MSNQARTATGHVIGALYRSKYWGSVYRVIGGGPNPLGLSGRGVRVSDTEGQRVHLTPVGDDELLERSVSIADIVLGGERSEIEAVARRLQDYFDPDEWAVVEWRGERCGVISASVGEPRLLTAGELAGELAREVVA